MPGGFISMIGRFEDRSLRLQPDLALRLGAQYLDLLVGAMARSELKRSRSFDVT